MIEKPIIFNYYNYGVPYYGSYYNMRFSISRVGDKPDFQMEAVTWPEPLCREKTPKEQQITKLFSFNEEGYVEVIAWLNEQHNLYVK